MTETSMPEVIHGDCIEQMAAMAASGRRFSSIVTDPPYGLSFMGKHWDAADNIAFRTDTWRLALDVLEPGGMLEAFGGARTQHRMACAIEDAGFEIRDVCMWIYGSGMPKSRALLKPAYEPIILARKPGPLRMLDIDGCRVATDVARPSRERYRDASLDETRNCYGTGINGSRAVADTMQGRFPANILHDGSDEVLEAFAQQGRRAGVHGAGAARDCVRGGEYDATSFHLGKPRRMHRIEDGGADQSSPARFFYQAKASKHDRCDSRHPTVKPISLMRWLTRLITPQGGTILDPFAGSGTTLAAAHMEGFHAVGIEREAEYIADIRRRIDALTATTQPAPLGGLFTDRDAAE